MRYRGRQSYDYGGGTTVSDKQAADLGLTLERKPRAMGGGQGRFTDTIHVLKDGEHIGTLVTHNNGLGHSERRTMLPDGGLQHGETQGSVYGHDIQWLLHRHATRAGAPVDFSHTSQVLRAHGAEQDRYAPRGAVRHVLKRRMDRAELLVHADHDGKGWLTIQRRPTFKKGVPATTSSHAQGIDPNSLHRAIAAWRNGKPVTEATQRIEGTHEHVTAAFITHAGTRHYGSSHREAYQAAAQHHGVYPERNTDGEGFVTSKGRHVSREEAWDVAKKAGQIRDPFLMDLTQEKNAGLPLTLNSEIVHGSPGFTGKHPVTESVADALILQKLREGRQC